MSLRSLQVVLRTLADADPPAADGDLLRRFAGGDEAAFAELVRRHGRLVWAVCRHLTGSDAEADDAFQATFLVLLRGAGRVRDAGRLSAWLHGVAYRVCAKARRAAQRRATRERAAAVTERDGHAVPESAWDRALAAVHEEAGRLPEPLRVPFVLCCLEGKCVTEAAEQVGWKLGTFSGRLTRAKDAVLARLDARGLTLGAVAGLGLMSPPAAAVARAAALARTGGIIPSSVLQLSQGVIGMSATSFKVLAAVLLTGGLGIGARSGWVATAEAQPPAKPAPAKADPAAELKRLQAELAKAEAAGAAARAQAQAAARQAREAEAQAEAERAGWVERMVGKGYMTPAALNTAKQSRWDYDFVEVKPLGETELVNLLRERDAQGWEFVGTTPVVYVRVNDRHSPPVQKWVFRRPTGAATGAALPNHNRALGDPAATPPAKPDDAKALEEEIARLQTRLAELKAKPTRDRAVFAKAGLPLNPVELAKLLNQLGEDKARAGRLTIAASDDSLIVEGDKAAVEWAVGIIKKLGEK